jgi:hypothetical protein
MSGIVGSRLNIRGSGLVGSLGTDGQVFTSSGAGAGAVYEAAAGGHGEAVDSWEFTSDFTGNAEPIASNWGRMDSYAWQNFPIGTGWTESSGVFTPPSIGLWFIDFQAVFSYNGDSTSTNSAIFVSGTAGQWGGACNQHHEDQGATTWSSARTTCIVDVANTTYSNFVVEFHVTSQDQSVTVNNGPHSRVHFWKIADT